MGRPLPPNELASRDAFFEREAAVWAALCATWEELPDEALEQPGACGPTWSVKDVLNHVAAWHEAALRVIGDLQAGRWGRLGSNTERFNQQHYALDQQCPLAESHQRLQRSRADLLALLRTLDEPQLLNEYGRQQIGWWAKWTTYAHYEQHLDDLRAFLVLYTSSVTTGPA